VTVPGHLMVELPQKLACSSRWDSNNVRYGRGLVVCTQDPTTVEISFLAGHRLLAYRIWERCEVILGKTWNCTSKATSHLFICYHPHRHILHTRFFIFFNRALQKTI
jgi:hypothetical protein